MSRPVAIIATSATFTASDHDASPEGIVEFKAFLAEDYPGVEFEYEVVYDDE